ncbi:helix-turn-helix domain-containing protein [Changpingibacter yushuensis]|uniref:helix-turn-helix domain-containing protein n=1 Tax=Changpingibacter yushuensis TaxID=2758440 RepID=UPI00165DB573|nr:helix-turn-helix domain-containing protein [Changpingibacter yushuensis]
MSGPRLSTDEIAAHLGVTKDTVYAWIADKGMPAHKIGRLWKCQASEVDDWVRTGAAASDAQHPHQDGDPYPERAHRKKDGQ